MGFLFGIALCLVAIFPEVMEQACKTKSTPPSGASVTAHFTTFHFSDCIYYFFRK
jgi:hypothetical protein